MKIKLFLVFIVASIFYCCSDYVSVDNQSHVFNKKNASGLKLTNNLNFSNKKNASGLKLTNNLNFSSKKNASGLKLTNNLNFSSKKNSNVSILNNSTQKLNELLNSVCGTVYFQCDGITEPAFGVDVTVKGTTNGTTTDSDSNYCISPVYDGSILQFSYIGFITQELTLEGYDCGEEFCISSVNDVVLRCDTAS